MASIIDTLGRIIKSQNLARLALCAFNKCVAGAEREARECLARFLKRNIATCYTYKIVYKDLLGATPEPIRYNVNYLNLDRLAQEGAKRAVIKPVVEVGDWSRITSCLWFLTSWHIPFDHATDIPGRRPGECRLYQDSEKLLLRNDGYEKRMIADIANFFISRGITKWSDLNRIQGFLKALTLVAHHHVWSRRETEEELEGIIPVYEKSCNYLCIYTSDVPPIAAYMYIASLVIGPEERIDMDLRDAARIVRAFADREMDPLLPVDVFLETIASRL